MTRINYALCLLVLLAVAVAGCGSDSDSTSGGAYSGKGGGASESKSKDKTASETEEFGVIGVVSVAEVGDLGKILIDRGHHVIYVFHKDKGTTSSCYGACEAQWPPLLTEVDPRAEGGAAAAKVGTTERKDGATQVTYAGHPLYTFVGDPRPEEANGNDVDAFGAEWYALQPNGEEPED